MELNYREFGEKGRPPLVILHGLLGSSRNWQAAGQALGEFFHVFCLDLRNHGDSPWAEPHSYEAMVADVLKWIDAHLELRPALMGHSMGGKIAMRLACEHPDRIRKLIVVDIAPKLYPKTHDDEFEGMRAIDLSALKSRSEAESALEPYVSSWAMRKFLVTNLEREDGGFRWTVNLDAIEPELREIEKSPLSQESRYLGDTLFIMGGQSNYFNTDDRPLMRRHFPASAVEVIAESGHNPHFEHRERFVEIVEDFVARS